MATFYVVNRGALAGDDFHAVALALGGYADFAVEIAFGFDHVARVVGRVFGEVAQLLAVQFFFALVGNQRQMLREHDLDFGVIGFNDDGVFGGEFFFVFFVGLLAFAFVFARGDFGFFQRRSVGFGLAFAAGRRRDSSGFAGGLRFGEGVAADEYE